MTALPPELADRTAVLLREVLGRAERLGEEALAPLGLAGREYGVLALVVHGGSTGNQRRLGETLGLDRTTTMKVAARLEARGLVERTPDEADRRSYRLTATDEGRALAARAGAVLAACDASLVEGRLSPAEAERLRVLLRRLR